jgi:RNA polymerase-interacting CarD/CdnL/TRCF family regulator
MKIKVGVPFVLPRFAGISTVLELYADFNDNTAEGSDLVKLATPEGTKFGYPADVVRKQGRPIMSAGDARQVLSILANRFAPVSELQPKMRIRRAQKVLADRNPIEMAKALRELLVRAQGGGGAPIRISFEETSLRNRLTESLCSELKEALRTDDKFKEQIGMGPDCEAAIQKIARRLNPAPASSEVGRYRAVYKAFPAENLASELRTIARTVKKKATSDNPEHRADLNARQHALLHVIDSRSRRNNR